MKTLLTASLLLLASLAFGQVRPDQQPLYDPAPTDDMYSMISGSVRRIQLSSLDSLFAAGSVSEITNVSDTSTISSPNPGDIAINSGNDTLMIHGQYGWIVFVGGSGGGSGSMDDWTLVADSGTPAVISDGESVTITGAGIASTSISGNAVTVTATEVDGSTNNEIQTVDTLAYASGTITLALENDSEAPYTVDISGVNTDAQTLSSSGDSLSISGGNTVYIGDTAVTARAFSGEILLDDIHGVYYSDYTQDGTIDFTSAVSGHVVGSGGYLRIVSNASDSINFSSDFNHIYGFTSGKALGAGTYEVYFHKTPSGVSVNIPGAVQIDPNAGLNPLSETPFLALIADSTSTFTKDSGEKVSAWASVSPGTYTMWQDTASYQPIYVDDTYDYVDFYRDTSHYMTQDTIATNELTGDDTPWSAVFVSKRKTANAWQVIWAARYNTNGDYMQSIQYDDNDTIYVSRREDGSPLDQIDKNISATDGNFHIIAVSFTGTTLTAYYDGVKTLDAVSVNSTSALTLDNFMLAAQRFGGGSAANFGDIQVRRLYMFDSAKSDTKLSNMSLFLNNIYSIY